MRGSVGVYTKLAMRMLHSAIDYLHSPAIVKLSALLAVVLRHITVVSFLIIILDAVTCSVEVKLLPLTLMREAVNGFRSKVPGGVAPTTYAVGRVMSGLRHSREVDTNTRQVNITWSPGHVNCLSLFEISSTFSTKRKMTERRKLGSICTSVYGDDNPKHQK